MGRWACESSFGQVEIFEQEAFVWIVAPKINEATIAHFFTLHHANISYYGGNSVIIPVPLDISPKMLEDSYKASYTPTPIHVKKFFDLSMEIAKSGVNEMEWYNRINEATTMLF